MFSSKQIQILEKAEVLFAKNGCDATTVRDIAKASSVSPAMISYYFSSKEKLIESLFDFRMQNSKLNVEHVVMNENISPIQKIEIIISQYVDRVFAWPEFYKIMLTEQMLNSNHAILNYIRQLKLNYAHLIEKVINEGISQKIIGAKKNIDIVLLISAMTGVVMQFVINKQYYQDYNKLSTKTEDELDDLLKIKLISFIKNFFKTQLQYAD